MFPRTGSTLMGAAAGAWACQATASCAQRRIARTTFIARPSVGWLVSHFQLIFRIKSFAVAFGGLRGNTIFCQPFGKVRVLSGQIVWNDPRNIFVFDDRAWKVRQLCVDVELIIY